MALSVPLSRFTSRIGGGSAFFVRPITSYENAIHKSALDVEAFGWHTHSIWRFTIVPVHRLRLDYSSSWFDHQSDLRLGCLGIILPTPILVYFATLGH